MTGAPGRRDVALTTLIDLLVQVVFVFTLLLIASGVIEGPPEERGYLAPEEWKTLVSIFDVDTKKAPREQIAQIKDRHDKLRRQVDDLDGHVIRLEKRVAGAPGYPPCRGKDGSEQFALSVTIDVQGAITAARLPNSYIAPGAEAIIEQTEGGISRQEFAELFAPWKNDGLSRKPQCKYTVTVRYDPRARAGDYQPAISAIWQIFRTQQILRQVE